MNVVWLKRDVRLHDHEPLALAATQPEPLLLLYVYEPCHLQSDSYHEAHHVFINEGLADLDGRVRTIASGDGGGLTLRLGDAVEVLAALHALLPIKRLLSHREVGNAISRARNARVSEWADAHGVSWTQCVQDGVSAVRHSELDEGSWAKKWSAQMSRPQIDAPGSLRLVSGRTILRGAILDAVACDVAHTGRRPSAQHGGEAAGLDALRSFFETRGERYSEELSSPLTGWDSCSRLSPYLAWGHISLRHTFQALSQRQEEVRALKRSGEETGGWLKSLAAHGARLRWRSHFSQKLHDQPSIEHENMVSTYDELRKDFDETKYEAWLKGRTGFPMVDACMRSLHHSGWLNFRMRCLLVSFASYQLWLDWRRLTPVMARLFLDYEPGIHYPQFQMQAGTTGINANRIYSPAKQAADHAGGDYEFIRRWVPELEHVPREHMVEPHKMPPAVQRECGCTIGVDYPAPIVDGAASYRRAVSEFARVRAKVGTKAEAAAVYEKHGSRKRPGGGGAREASGAKRRAREGKLGADATEEEAANDPAPPFAAETAASGRASCRSCSAAIGKGSRKVCVSMWARGGRISASHHLACFMGGLRVELCPANRGKCKHSGAPFVKGALRVGYPTSSSDAVAWVCLESAKALLPALVAEGEDWASDHLGGYAALPPGKAEEVARELGGLTSTISPLSKP